jgi:hypothetical protein
MENPDFVDADLPIPCPNVTWNYVKDRLGAKCKSWTTTTPKADNEDAWLEEQRA